MRISYKRLLTGLNMLKKSIGKGTLPVLSMVHIEPISDTEVEFATTNLDRMFTFQARGPHDFRGPVHVSFDGLHKAITNKKCDFVDLIPDFDEGQLLVVQKNRTVKLKIQDLGDDFPTVSEEEGFPEKVHLTLNNGNWRDIRKIVLPCAATDDSRPVLAGVQVESTPDGYFFAAADGFRLGTFRVPGEFPIQFDSFIIPADSLKAIPEKAAGITFWSKEEDSRVDLTFRYEEVRFRLISRLIDGTFPDWRQIVPTEFHTKLKVHADVVNEAAKLNLDNGMLRFSEGSASGTLDGENKYEWNGSSVRLSGSEEMALNAKYVKDALSLVDPHQYLTLRAFDYKSAWLARTDNAQMVIMPMNVKES